MSSERGSAWTLIMSFNGTHRTETQFKSTHFKVNAPVRQDDFNWGQYRLSLERMTSLRQNSTHWRATCSYPQFGVDLVDYVRGTSAEFDIMTYLGSGIYKKVEYINIRGYHCYSCTDKWWQILCNYLLHVDSTVPVCNLDASKGVVSSKDNFGSYYKVSTKFLCTAGISSLAQFGGYQ